MKYRSLPVDDLKVLLIYYSTTDYTAMCVAIRHLAQQSFSYLFPLVHTPLFFKYDPTNPTIDISTTLFNAPSQMIQLSTTMVVVVSAVQLAGRSIQEDNFLVVLQRWRPSIEPLLLSGRLHTVIPPSRLGLWRLRWKNTVCPARCNGC